MGWESAGKALRMMEAFCGQMRPARGYWTRRFVWLVAVPVLGIGFWWGVWLVGRWVLGL